MRFSIKLIRDVGFGKTDQEIAAMIMKRCYPNSTEDTNVDYDEGLNSIYNNILPTDDYPNEWIKWFVAMRHNPKVLKYYGTEERISRFKTFDDKEFLTYEDAFNYVDSLENETINNLALSLTINGIIIKDDTETWEVVSDNNTKQYEKYVVIGIDSQLHFCNSYTEAISIYQNNLDQLTATKNNDKPIYQLIKSECGKYEAWDLVFPT